MDIQENQSQQVEKQESLQKQDENVDKLKQIRASIKSMEVKQIKELRRLLRIENLQNVEEITTLEYLMMIMNNNALRSALVQLQNQYKMMYRTLGDGNCFYRSIMLNKVFWLVEQKSCEPLEQFIIQINNIPQLQTIFQTVPINANSLKSIYLLFLFKILEDKKSNKQLRMLDIIRMYNSLPEVDFASVIICRQMIFNTYESFKVHDSFKDFLDDDMKEKIEFVLLRYFYEAQYVIIPLAAQTFQCELNIQNFYQPDQYSSKVNIEKLNYSPIEVENKDAQMPSFNLIYNGGHYELAILDSQAKTDFYKINKQMISFNTQYSDQQYYYFIQNFIQRYQTEIIRMNNIEESAFYNQQNGSNEEEEYQTLDWQKLQRSEEYRRQNYENQKLKVLIENLQNENNQVKQQDDKLQQKQQSNSQIDSQQEKNSKNQQNEIPIELDEKNQVNKTNQYQPKIQQKSQSSQFDQNNQNLQFQNLPSKNSMTNQQNNSGENDVNNMKYDQQDQRVLDFQNMKRICVQCNKKLPSDFKYPFFVLPMDEDIPDNVVLRICTDCFIDLASKYQNDQEFIEVNGKLYQLSPRLIGELISFIQQSSKKNQKN
ncbi:peptidase C65 otubain protein (macronuclear) [Tetrahymena thermophila SB210]|uniref:ubiquitinyl hydrolase 1 n=1 Tax=Tetrahymena thermophila (strain SB210) TaxID=312017 RepID=Q22S65_TETTS|nr:peptidase C65 otubain protein [Tetrahymena thermophila SB210]EAR87907.1 peptidase C65 otubain protein [Tetrahymena thermophila SB210]|eukprot:XP_001008152.1 peptidase C65 otubain protein [Tetrahymena thermophila SB210]